MDETTNFQSAYTRNEDYSPLSIADTDRTNEEREAMRERGVDDMDMVRAWLS